MEIYELLKKIRVERKISQKRLARNITTRESISKYENGKNNIPFVILLEILVKLNLNIDEFVFYLDNDAFKNKNAVINSWRKAKKEERYPPCIVKEVEIKAEKTNDIADIRNYLLIRTHNWATLPEKEKQLNKKDQKYLHSFRDYLENIHIWGRFDMVSFSSLLFLFDTNYIYHRIQDIQQKIKTDSNVEIFHPLLFDLYNTAFHLMLERKNLSFAKIYLENYVTMCYDPLTSYTISLKQTFYSALLAHIEGDNVKGKKQLLNIFKGLELLGSNKLKKDWVIDLRKYEKIYGVTSLSLKN